METCSERGLGPSGYQRHKNMVEVEDSTFKITSSTQCELCQSSMASLTLPRVGLRVSHHVRRRREILSVPYRQAATYTSPHQAGQISLIPTAVDSNSNTYRDNAAAMGALTAKLAQLHAESSKGGPERSRQKHVQRGKMLVRDRITALLDPGSSFLELSALAGHDLYPGEEVPAGGMVTGIGTVEGVTCMIVANDSTYACHSTCIRLILDLY